MPPFTTLHIQIQLQQHVEQPQLLVQKPITSSQTQLMGTRLQVEYIVVSVQVAPQLHIAATTLPLRLLLILLLSLTPTLPS